MENNHLETQLLSLTANIRGLAQECHHNHHDLLSLLRTLELLHREIREQIFEPSLPNTRHSLSQLLKEIQDQGGWPYIERMKLQALLVNLKEFDPDNSETEESGTNLL